MNGERQAFWSYVHEDDDDEGGRVSELSRLLAKRIRLLTGAGFPIFLDRDSIGWGDDWEQRIDEALLGTTFFVPVITPSYFLSESCRAELVRFSSAAKKLGLEELILPVYYVNVRELEDPPGPGTDELIQLVRRYRWEDWREIALEDPGSSVYRKAVDRLATQLLTRAASADSKPSVEPGAARAPRSRVVPAQRGSSEAPEPAEHGEEAAADEDEEPDRLGLLAAGEEAMPRLAARVNELSPIIEEMGEFSVEATDALQRSDAQGKGFAGRLAVSRDYASNLEGIGDRLEAIVPGYLDDLIAVDGTVGTILEVLKEDPSQIEGSAEFLDAVIGLAVASEVGFTSSDQLATIIHSNARWSKDLRKPSRRIETALRQMSDTRSIFGQWKDQIEDLRAKAS